MTVTTRPTAWPFQAREEYKLSDRAYVNGQGQYLRDPFKAIDYLFATTGGLGYKLADNDTTKFSVDGGAGVTWEKNPGIDTRTYGAIIAGEDSRTSCRPQPRSPRAFTRSGRLTTLATRSTRSAWGSRPR